VAGCGKNAASLKKSYIWDCVKTYKLIYNMRLNGPDAVETRQHANYLLSVGEGTNGFAENCVLPQNMALEDNTLEKLIDYTLVHYKFVAYSLLFRP
jgi:hypothetical protein